jgi:hypothetical protein
VTEAKTEQEVGGTGRRPPRSLARVAGWLIVPLYIASLSASYFFRFSIESWSKSSLVDNVEGVMLDVGFGAFAVVGALLVARRPANTIGWIMASIGLMVAIFTTGDIIKLTLVYGSLTLMLVLVYLGGVTTT